MSMVTLKAFNLSFVLNLHSNAFLPIVPTHKEPPAIIKGKTSTGIVPIKEEITPFFVNPPNKITNPK